MRGEPGLLPNWHLVKPQSYMLPTGYRRGCYSITLGLQLMGRPFSCYLDWGTLRQLGLLRLGFRVGLNVRKGFDSL